MPLKLASLLAAAFAIAGCGGDDEATPTATQSSAGSCRSVQAPEPREPAARAAPKTPADPNATYRAVVETNCGSFTIELDPKTSPNTVASFVALANDGYFDDTTFHRIVPDFVIQGGDPSASGMGGPGYMTVDTPSPDTTYTKGVVAMAKAVADPRGAAGSQFFVVTGATLQLAPDYAVIGRVTEGLDVVEQIGQLGDPVTEQPTEPVVVASISVTPDG